MVTVAEKCQKKPAVPLGLAVSDAVLIFQPEEFKFMLLGADDGSVEVLSVPTLSIVAVIKGFAKLIQSLAWHPTYLGSSSQPSAYKDWIAVASNENVVHVWNLTDVLSGSDTTAGRNAAGSILYSLCTYRF